MVDMAKGAGSKAVSVGAAVASGGASLAGQVTAARTAATAMGKGGKLGTLTQLGRNYAMSRSPVQAYRGAMKSFSENLTNTGDKYRREITNEIQKRTQPQGGSANTQSNTSGNPSSSGNTP